MLRFIKYTLIIICIASCYKLKSGWKDTKFRNKFEGIWQIDSLVNESYRIDSVYHDIVERMDVGKKSFIEIKKTKNQIDKNPICTGKFRDTTFNFLTQGFNDKGSERLILQPCTDCNTKEGELILIKYLVNTYYIKELTQNRLVMKSKWWVNGIEKGNTLYLHK